VHSPELVDTFDARGNSRGHPREGEFVVAALYGPTTVGLPTRDDRGNASLGRDRAIAAAMHIQLALVSPSVRSRVLPGSIITVGITVAAVAPVY